MKIQFDKSTSLRVLCLGAHCDDVEIGAGGTILKLIEEYKIEEITWVVFSSNEVRKNEATLSANKFLSKITNKNIIIKDFRDGFLPFHAIEVKEFFEELKMSCNPDIIFTHYRNDGHQDHRFINNLTWNTWRNHLILEYEIPKYDGDLGNPNLYVELSDDYINKRNQIILETFTSQSNKHWFDDAAFKALARIRGMESATLFAEAFYSRKLFF